MAAAQIGDDVLAEFYGYDEPAGGNPGPPAQAEIINFDPSYELYNDEIEEQMKKNWREKSSWKKHTKNWNI